MNTQAYGQKIFATINLRAVSTKLIYLIYLYIY